MLGALVLAATAATGSQFLDDFGGTWRCGNAQYHAAWSVARASGDKNPWTVVTVGDASAPFDVAYVGYLPQTGKYVYRDFHTDGALAELSAAAPVDGTWHWTGTYYPAGGAADPGPDITWTLTPSGTIERRFSQVVNGKTVQRGADTCTKATP